MATAGDQITKLVAELRLRNDRIRRQDGETEESRCSEMPWLHEYGYRKTATSCQMPNDCNFRKRVISFSRRGQTAFRACKHKAG